MQEKQIPKMPNLQPMLAMTADKPFSDKDWIFEPKLDGIRALAYVQGKDVVILSRRGLDFTERYPAVEEALKKQDHRLILDGEITALDAQGRPSFQLLQGAGRPPLKGRSKRNTNVTLVYYVFDILYADGEKLSDLPLDERRDQLRKLVKEDEVVRIVRDFGCDGIKAFEACINGGLEGVIAKRVDGIYQAGRRSSAWLKVKGFKSSEFVICGFTRGVGSRVDFFGSLILGYYDQSGELAYAGAVGTGFHDRVLEDLFRRMKAIKQSESPFKKKITTKQNITWLNPTMVAEIKFAEWTRDGLLRIPVFLRLREDIAPADVRITLPS